MGYQDQDSGRNVETQRLEPSLAGKGGQPEVLDREEIKPAAVNGYNEPEVAEQPKDLNRRWQFKWSNIILMSALHAAAIPSYIYVCRNEFKIETILFCLVIGMNSGLGTSAGAHRLWTHRSYRARWPLKLWLMFFQTITMNGSIFSYARDHRTHHKHSDTDADPKNPSRGLFYSHIGWWLVKKNEAVKQAGSRLDFADLRRDPIVWFQHRYYRWLFVVFGVLIPWLVPVFLWNEDPLMALSTCVILRILVILHHIFTVNSIAHFIGNRPYDFRIWPADHRLTNYLSFGEGIHNYHHVFPYDYRINERPQWEMFNPITAFIDFNRLLGLAYDCKTASPTVVRAVIKNRGHIETLRREPSRPLWHRMLNAILDWIAGLVVTSWAVIPIIAYKLYTGRPLFTH